MLNAEQRKALAVLAMAQTVISGTYLMAKLGLREFSPLCFGLYRFLLAAAVFTALLAFRGELRLPSRRDRGTFLWLAFLVVPLNQGLFLYGIKHTLAAHGALFYATTPIMVFVLSCLFLGERPTWTKAAGIAVGFAGVLLVLSDQRIAISRDTLKGDALIILAVITWAAYTVISKKMLSRYRPLYVTGISLSLGFVMFVPVGLLPALQQDYSKVGAAGLASLLYLALLTSVMGYLVWIWGLSKLEASKVTVLSNLQPILAALLAWFFLGEAVTARFVLGATAVAAGVALTERG
jgi:drug/metabolite transporter (DMT)-like permease